MTRLGLWPKASMAVAASTSGPSAGGGVWVPKAKRRLRKGKSLGSGRFGRAGADEEEVVEEQVEEGEGDVVVVVVILRSATGPGSLGLVTETGVEGSPASLINCWMSSALMYDTLQRDWMS